MNFIAVLLYDSNSIMFVFFKIEQLPYNNIVKMTEIEQNIILMPEFDLNRLFNRVKEKI